MDVLWRTGVVVFALIALTSMGVLVATWLEWPPLMPALTAANAQSWFRPVEYVLLATSAVGFVGLIVFAFAAPRTSKRLYVERDRGGIRISQTALRAETKQIVEAHPGLSVQKAAAKIVGRRNPHMSVNVKIDPGDNADLGELGALLQKEIADTLEHFSSCPVRKVGIVFVEARRAHEDPQPTTR